jgi:hypothetical protein
MRLRAVFRFRGEKGWGTSMKYSQMARDRAIRCAAVANQAIDEGVRSALLDLAAAYMRLAGELARSKEVLDVTLMSMPLPP